MHWNENVERLLNATTKAVEALADMAECEELTNNIDKQSACQYALHLQNPLK